MDILKKFMIFSILLCVFSFVPNSYSQLVVEEPVVKTEDGSKISDKDLMMIAISIASPVISILAAWKISDMYHKKKNKADEVFEQNRKDKLDSLKHRTGQSYSMFKEKVEHILDKNIVEQDLVAFSSNDYSQLVDALRHNRKNITDNWDEYATWVTNDEISKYTNFFTSMLWLLRILQLEKFNEYDIQEANDICKSIKLISDEFDGISHIIRLVSTMSLDDSKKLHGITDFKSPVTQR